MGCKFGSSVLLISGGPCNFQLNIHTQKKLEFPSPSELL